MALDQGPRGESAWANQISPRWEGFPWSWVKTVSHFLRCGCQQTEPRWGVMVVFSMVVILSGGVIFCQVEGSLQASKVAGMERVGKGSPKRRVSGFPGCFQMRGWPVGRLGWGPSPLFQRVRWMRKDSAVSSQWQRPDW